MSGLPGFEVLQKQFLDGLSERLSLMYSAFDKGGMEELAAVAHKLKGTSGSFGYPQLGEIAAKLEVLAKESNSVAAKSVLQELTIAIEKLVK